MTTAVAPANASAAATGATARPQDIAVGCVLSLFVCITVFGNSLVIVAVLTEHYLRTITNYFIVSLATADLLMGAVVMPFAVATHVTGDYWPFGQVWCDLWHAFDVLSSTASILNLCMIAVERYWAIENPMTYPSKVTKRRCLMMIGAVWVCSCLISFPAISWWRAVADSREIGDRCQFTGDPAYLVCSSIVSFYAPLLVMVFVYCKIYRTATQLVRGWQSGAKVLRGTGLQPGVVLRIHRGGGGAAGHGEHPPDRDDSCCCENSALAPAGADEALATTLSDEENHSLAGGARGFASRLRSSFGVRKKLVRFSREQRAAKTLGVVMGVFIACWMPFFVCNVIVALTENGLGESEGRVFAVVTWLGYVNSSVNPAIYAHSMRDFRRAFIKLLSCHRRRGGAVPRLANGGGRRRQHLTAAAAANSCTYSCGCSPRTPDLAVGRRGDVSDVVLRATGAPSRSLSLSPRPELICGHGEDGYNSGGSLAASPSLSPALTPLRRPWGPARERPETEALLMRELRPRPIGAEEAAS